MTMKGEDFVIVHDMAKLKEIMSKKQKKPIHIIVDEKMLQKGKPSKRLLSFLSMS